MNKNLIGILCVLGFLGSVCIAQSNNPQVITNWGESIAGVQMAITLNTNAIITGEITVIYVEIKNSSTNAIYMYETTPAVDFHILLIGDSGKKYELGDTHPRASTRSLRMKLDSGNSHSWILSITIGKNIEPGDYTLKTTRKFKASEGNFELNSNLLKVQIK